MRIGIDASRTFVENPTGTERYAWEITSRLLSLPEAKKHTWKLYVKPGLKSIRQLPNVQIITIKLPYLWTQVGLALRTWMDRLDVLWVPAHTLPVLRNPGIKTVVTIHGLEYEWLPAYENPLQRWYLPMSTIYASKTASKVIAVSEFTKRQLVERVGIDEGKIRVVYEGFTAQTPNSKSQATNKSQISIFKKYNIKPKKYLLFVGTIQPRKNLERLIEVLAKLPFDYAQGDKLKLVIAGKWGWKFDGVKEAVNKFGVKDRVIFTGYISDTDRYILLANALVYVQPSITEGFGLPVLEAMSMGVPVVSSNGGALGEILQNAGLLFNPYDVSDMSEKIRLMVEDKSMRLKMIKRGNVKIKNFSWNKAAYETYNIMTNIF